MTVCVYTCMSCDLKQSRSTFKFHLTIIDNLLTNHWNERCAFDIAALNIFTLQLQSERRCEDNIFKYPNKCLQTQSFCLKQNQAECIETRSKNIENVML